MQKVYFVVVGKIKESFYREAVAEYVKRLSRFAKVEIKELPEGANLEAEGEDILRACNGVLSRSNLVGYVFFCLHFNVKRGILR